MTFLARPRPNISAEGLHFRHLPVNTTVPPIEYYAGGRVSRYQSRQKYHAPKAYRAADCRQNTNVGLRKP